MSAPDQQPPGQGPNREESTPTKIVITGHYPYVTQVATGLMIATFLSAYDLKLVPEPGQLAGVMEAFSPQRIWEGNAWRLLLAPFVHASIFHLFCCAIAFWITGSVVERVLGHRFIFGMIFFGALFSSGMQLLANAWPSLGASPLVFALFGAMLTARRSRLEFQIALAVEPLSRFWIWLAGFSLLGLVGSGPLLEFWGVGNPAQAAGLLFGVAAGWLAVGRSRPLAAAGVIFIALAAGVILAVTWMPWRGDWQFMEYRKHLEANNYPAAVQVLERMDRTQPGVLNALAWTKATARDATVRDGKEAIELARQALNQTEWSEPGVIDTLAAAYAEAGKWELALQTQQIAVAAQKRLERIFDGPFEGTADLEENLKTIEKREPVRE